MNIQVKNIELKIRTVPNEDDIENIRNLVTDTGFFRPDEIEIATELIEERLEKGLNCGYRFFMADSGGKLVGYTCYGLIPCSLVSWDLYWIVTSKELQGQGIGRLLLEMTENSILKEGGMNVIIETSSKDLYRHTQKFYDKNGYLLHTRFTDFYDIGDDKLVYVKRLQ
jgi:GNAT superfamily N-acetyltransferase